MNPRFRRPIKSFPKKPVPKKEGCKIKVRKTKTGKEISFSGNCSKSELDIAKGNIED